MNKWELINAMEAAVRALKMPSFTVGRTSEYGDAILPFQMEKLIRVERALQRVRLEGSLS
jgi:hypothetical protein